MILTGPEILVIHPTSIYIYIYLRDAYTFEGIIKKNYSSNINSN